MKTADAQIADFHPVINMRPWRVRLGVGSFVTFEFGDKVRAHGRVHGTWHLWIYMAAWSLVRNGRELANSDSERPTMSVALRRLEEQPLSEIEFGPDEQTTTFMFDGFRLVVRPADYIEDPDERDEYWMLFLPNGKVVSYGPTGLSVEQENATHQMPNAD
jgi:hypothetical protein